MNEYTLTLHLWLGVRFGFDGADPRLPAHVQLPPVDHAVFGLARGATERQFTVEFPRFVPAQIGVAASGRFDLAQVERLCASGQRLREVFTGSMDDLRHAELLRRFDAVAAGQGDDLQATAGRHSVLFAAYGLFNVLVGTTDEAALRQILVRLAGTVPSSFFRAGLAEPGRGERETPAGGGLWQNRSLATGAPHGYAADMADGKALLAWARALRA